jgi:hypothetical protein
MLLVRRAQCKPTGPKRERGTPPTSVIRIPSLALRAGSTDVYRLDESLAKRRQAAAIPVVPVMFPLTVSIDLLRSPITTVLPMEIE